MDPNTYAWDIWRPVLYGDQAPNAQAAGQAQQENQAEAPQVQPEDEAGQEAPEAPNPQPAEQVQNEGGQEAPAAPNVQGENQQDDEESETTETSINPNVQAYFDHYNANRRVDSNPQVNNANRHIEPNIQAYFDHANRQHAIEPARSYNHIPPILAPYYASISRWYEGTSNYI